LHADMLLFFGMHVLYRDDPDRQLLFLLLSIPPT
jgi:hypothetical protein